MPFATDSKQRKFSATGAGVWRGNLPGWWFRWNGFGEFRWTVKLDPGESAHLEAKWHYFWQ
jgi:hypothetical protein